MDFCTNCVNEYAWRPTDKPFPKECKKCEVIDGKPSNFKPKNKTNTDRIRAMSEEELANIIAGTPICKERYMDCLKDGQDCEACLLEWLKQPAEVDNG